MSELGDSHPELHSKLAHYYKELSLHNEQLAAYHYFKSISPISDIPIPEKSELLKELEKSLGS